jgi:hypothetical protein
VVVGPGRLFIGCAEGVVEILLIQPAGRGRMAAAEFLRGYAARLGATLDTGIASIQSGGDAEATDKIASAGGTDPSCDAPVFT